MRPITSKLTFISMAFAVTAMFISSANADLVQGFESGAAGLQVAGATIVPLTTGPLGATEGSSAAQVDNPLGGFTTLESFDGSFFAAFTDPANAGGEVKFDVTVTLNDPDVPFVFGLVNWGINSQTGGFATVTGSGQAVSVGTNSLVFNFDDLPSAVGSTFAGPVFTLNTAANADLTWSIDNFSVHPPETAVIPEPSALALLGGLSLLGFCRRRR